MGQSGSNKTRSKLSAIPWNFSRPTWPIALACLLLLLSAWLYVQDIVGIVNQAHHMAHVESSVQAAIGDIRICHARQVGTVVALLDQTADGEQGLSPAWRSTVIAFERQEQEFQSALKLAYERVRISQNLGTGNEGLEDQLFELQVRNEKAHNDLATVVRLAQEGRSDDIAAMHSVIRANAEAMEEQLLRLNQMNQLSLIGAAKQIRHAGQRAFWSGLVTFAISTTLLARWWSRRQRAARVSSKSQEKQEQQPEGDQFARVTEQVLAERFLMRGVHVLIAEDDVSSRRLLARVFDDAGAVVTLACDGSQALQQFRKAASSGHPVQLVILDLLMPEMDGLQVAMHLRDLEQFEGPLLALTAMEDSQVRSKCLEAGFDDYLAKPIERQRLLQLSTDYLGKTAVS